MQILLLVGTKLELIIVEMAQEMHDRNTVVKGAPVVEPNNKYFWFNRPEWTLLLIHYTLFQVSLELVIFSCQITYHLLLGKLSYKIKFLRHIQWKTLKY